MKHTHTIACAATFVVLGASVALAAEEERFVAPFLAISEEYTDNVFDSKDNHRTDYITRVRPGLTSKYQSSRIQLEAAYNLDYRYYARKSKTKDISHDAGLKSSITVVENFLFLDLADTYKRVSLNVLRDDTTASSFANQTEQNIATVNPWLLWRPGQKTILKTGYRYIDTRYWDSAGINKYAHSGYADAIYEMTSKFNLLANYIYTNQKSEDNQRFDKHDASGGFKYTYAEKSYLYANGGYTWQFYKDMGASRYLFWNAGVVHDFSLFVATLETRRQNAEDPLSTSSRETSYVAKLDRAFERGSIGVSGGYTEYEYNNRQTTISAGGNKHKSFVGVNGRYEILDGLTMNASAMGEHYHYATVTTDNYPYRLVLGAGLTWQMLKELALNLSYSRVANQYHVDNNAGGWYTNRAILELKMTF